MLNRIYIGRKLTGRFLLLLLTIVTCMGFSERTVTALYKGNDCKNPDVKVEAKYESQDKKKGILVIEYKDENASSLIVSVVGPNKFYIKSVKESELKGLSKGSYTVVIVGKDDSQNYCPTHIQLEI